MGNSMKPVRHRLKMRDMAYMKPEGYEKFMTLTEVSRAVGRDTRWIRRLENENRIPKAYRVQAGELQVRLWSPEQVNEIREVLSNMRRGRPRNA